MINAAERQTLLRRILAEYSDDADRRRVLRRATTRVLATANIEDADRREMVADVETSIALFGVLSPFGRLLEDLADALTDAPVSCRLVREPR